MTGRIQVLAIIMLALLVSGFHSHLASGERELPVPDNPLDPPMPPPLPPGGGVVPGPPGGPPSDNEVKLPPPSAFPRGRYPPVMPVWPPPEPPIYNAIPDLWWNFTPDSVVVNENIDVRFTLVGMNATIVTMYYQPVGENVYKAVRLALTLQSYIYDFNYPYGFYYRDVQVWEGAIPAQTESGYMNCYWVVENESARKVFPEEWAYPYILKVVDIHPPVVSHTPPPYMVMEKNLTITINATDDVHVWMVVLWWRALGDENETRVQVPMVSGTDRNGTWSVDIPFQRNLSAMEYRFMVSDGWNKVYYPQGGYTLLHVKDPYPPVIRHSPVGNASVLFSTEITAVVWDNVAVSEVDISYRIGNTPWETERMRLVNGTVINGTYSYTIPRVFVPVDIDYYITALGIGEKSRAPITPDSYYTIRVRDDSPPLILHSPPGVVLENRSFTLEVVAIDDMDVREVSVYYRMKGSEEWQRDGLELFTVDASNGVWRVRFAPVMGNGTMEYHFAASDGNLESVSEDFELNILSPAPPPGEAETGVKEPTNRPFSFDLMILSLMAVAVASVLVYEFLKKRSRRNSRRAFP